MLLTAAYAAAVLSNAALGTHISRYERDTESSVSEGVCGVVKSGTEYTSLTVSFTRNGTNMTYSWSMETTGDCVTFLDDVLEPCKGPSALYCEYLDFSFKLPSTGVATTQYSDQLRSSNMNGREPGSSTTSLIRPFERELQAQLKKLYPDYRIDPKCSPLYILMDLNLITSEMSEVDETKGLQPSKRTQERQPPQHARIDPHDEHERSEREQALEDPETQDCDYDKVQDWLKQSFYDHGDPEPASVNSDLAQFKVTGRCRFTANVVLPYQIGRKRKLSLTSNAPSEATSEATTVQCPDLADDVQPMPSQVQEDQKEAGAITSGFNLVIQRARCTALTTMSDPPVSEVRPPKQLKPDHDQVQSRN
ncbi:hypothetical protein CBS147321_7950 [Aspergillus niger]|nr:hypothetical protein CBS12448_9987 [Aspergillus niger]KAI2873082.1 hypothetical protein CBS11852_10820 [Aspergillus niger]KAI2937235.1 hypothetical protein CBS147321_7950 [Aspergillus niger]KAI2944531.1 hypothetical protein CBS147322_8060 [Aspergillus niger]KAI2992177.1 hypothetical protein CBS147345_10334 [Aspergillus niger]